MSERKTYTPAQKLEILMYYNQNGMADTLATFEISKNSLYTWLKENQHKDLVAIGDIIARIENMPFIKKSIKKAIINEIQLAK